MTTGAKPAGWYEDPHGYTGTARWWDGSAWTDQTRAIGAEGEEPASADEGPAPSADAPATPVATGPVPAGPGAADPGPAGRGSDASGPGSVWPAAAAFASPAPPPQRVVFEVVEPDRRKKRIVAAVAFGAVAIGATVLGVVLGASGDDDKKSPGTDANPPAASAPATASAGPPASNAAPVPGATPAPTAPAPPPPVAVPADAVAHWELNQGGADTRERFHGTTAGNVTWSPEQSGSAFFSGGGSIQTREPVVDTTRSFTITAWAKVTDTKAHQTIVAQDGTQVSGFYLHYNKDARTWAFVRTSEDAANPAQWYTAAASQPAKIGAWTSLAAVYDAPARQMTLYVDGVAQGSAVAAQQWKAAGPLTIGRATSGVDRLNGSVADVQAFDRALSAAEVAALAGTQR
ncbi:DUF2510 domain-containing protein [Streptomycetaceae bacterium NBC_01309]